VTDAYLTDEPLDYDPAEVERLAEIERLRDMKATDLIRMVDDFRDGTEVGRGIGEKARRYFDGDQLDSRRITQLTRARQPRVIRNEIKPAINGLLGILVQAKVDPKAYPRNPDNEEQADVASKALRYVADANRLHKIKIDLAETHLIEGVCACVVEVNEKNDVIFSRVRYDEMIYDPRSREADFVDARYKGVGKWLYEQDVRAMYPDFADDLSVAFSGSNGSDMGLGQMYADKPNQIGTYWADPKLRRLFIVELYHRDPMWMRSVFYVGGVLEHGESPYLDDEGQPTCPVVMGSCYIDIDNQRYGVVRSMLSPQDELNAYSSRALHLANSRQLQVADPSYPPEVDAKTASVEAAKADGVIPTGYQVVPTTDLFAGINVMVQDARQALVRQAPTPAVLAEASATNQSGRSRLVLQQAGMTEIARAMGRLEDVENELYRQAWMRLKQFKREPWWVRITGDDAKSGFEGMNIPVGPDGEPVQPGMMPVGMKNELATMDVDIEVETIPDTANLQAEQFEALAPMLPLLAEAKGPEKAFELGLAMSSIPDKHRIKEILDSPPGADNPQAQQMAAMQQQMQEMAVQMQQMAAQADIEKTKSETVLNEAKVRQIEGGLLLDAVKIDQPPGVAQSREPEY